MSNIKLKNVKKIFEGVEVISSINLEIEDGEFCVFVGPSGCGKSTLLRLISGLEDVTSGIIEIDGVDVSYKPPAERKLAMVFQSYALYPHMTVYKNIAFPLKMAKIPKEQIDEKVKKVAETLNLTKYLERRPSQLSGGQRQRVAIGRAIVREPCAFLFDEPLSNLDAALRVNMRFEISQLHQRLKTTMIYVTHDQVEAMTMADKIVIIQAGSIEQIGTPLELYRKPKNKFVASFIGSPKMNFIEGSEAKKYNSHSIGIRPEHFIIDENNGLWKGIVSVAEHLGSDTLLYIKTKECDHITVRVNRELNIKYNDLIYITPNEDRIYKFDEKGNLII